MKKFVFILALSIFFVSCDETKKVIDTAGSVQLSGAYDVVTVNGAAISDNKPTISFTALDKGINGNTGCNKFFGKYNVDLYAVNFSDIASTEMACEQPIMDVENQFLQALRNTGSYALEDGMLTLYSKNDRSVLITAKKDKGSE